MVVEKKKHPKMRLKTPGKFSSISLLVYAPRHLSQVGMMKMNCSLLELEHSERFYKTSCRRRWTDALVEVWLGTLRLEMTWNDREMNGEGDKEM